MLLVVFHVSIVIASNYLVQFPIELFGWQSTWGAFSFPFIFIASDLTVRLLGKAVARRVIARVMLPALCASYLISALFHEGQFNGWASMLVLNIFVLRISLASFAAYVTGQLVDIHVFNRLRNLPQWWVAPSAAAIVGNLIDTAVFFSVAFWKSSSAFMAEHWIEIAFVDYLIKIAVSIVLFVPLYGAVLACVTRYFRFEKK